ncbi:hypothetical protein BGW39_005446 [Mortierella sp. 14UC]|nr:hypothetical protein BGW39_005446 [Mortierella sp. 14UC]
MAKGNAVVVMKNTRKTSNLYGATHAGTMVSFTETTSALAVFSLFGPKDRALCTNLNIDYLKKGTGILTATSAVPKVKDRSVKNIYTEVIVTNEKIETVAKMTLTFRTDFRSEKTD